MDNFWKWTGRTSEIATLASIVISFMKGWWNVSDIMLFWNKLTPGIFMLILVGIFILIIFMSWVFRFVKYGIPRSFTAKLGVYWDKEMNPFCPTCKIILAGKEIADNVLHCPKCKEDFNLRHGAKFIPVDVAQKMIKDKEI